MWVQGSTYIHTYYQKLAKAPCLFHKAGCMYAPGLLVSVFGYMRDQYIISAGLSRFAIRSLSTAQEVVEWGWPVIIPSISTVYTRKKFQSITWAHVSQLSQYHFKSGEPYEVFFSPLTDEAGIFILFHDKWGRNCFVRELRGQTFLDTSFGNPRDKVGDPFARDRRGSSIPLFSFIYAYVYSGITPLVYMETTIYYDHQRSLIGGVLQFNIADVRN